MQEKRVDERINIVNEILEKQPAETPIVETPETPTEQVETPSEQPTETPAVVTETPTKTWKDEFFENTGLQFSDEVVTKLKSEPKTYEFKSELAKRLEEIVPKGISEKDFLKIQSVDWDEVTPESGMKSILAEQHKDLTKDEIEILFNRKYKIPKPLDPDTHTEDEVAERDYDIKAAQIQLKSKWAQYREQKKAEQIKFGEPKQPSKEDLDAEAKRQELANKNYKNTIDAFEKSDAITMEVKDGEEVRKLTYKLNADEKAKAKYILERPHERFLELFFDKDGNINSNDFVETVYSIVGGKKLREALARDYAGELMGLDVMQRKNIDFTKRQQNATPTLTGKEKAVDELRNKRYGQNNNN